MLLVDSDVALWAPDLFHTEAYARLHAPRFSEAGIRYSYTRPGTHEVLGVFQAAQLRHGVFASPGRGPYGGFHADASLSEEELRDFLVEVEGVLRKAGASQLEVVLPPFCYAPQQGPQTLALLCQRGYRVVRQELNQSISVGEKAFAAQADHATRKRLHKAARAGVSVRLLAPSEHQAGYETILENRRKKGRTLSMSWPDVQEMAAAFPERVRLVGAEQDGVLLAAAICLAVSEKVLYVYAWGERAGAEAVSPVSALAAHLFTLAQREGFSLLDLGTSSVDGIVNPGLLRFKRSLGATSSLKLTLSKVFA